MLIFDLTAVAIECDVLYSRDRVKVSTLDAIVYCISEAFKRCYGFSVVPAIQDVVDFKEVGLLEKRCDFDKLVYFYSAVITINNSASHDYVMRRFDNVVIICNRADDWTKRPRTI